MAKPFANLIKGIHDKFMAHISPEVVARADAGHPMTWEEWQAGRWNSYERKLLVPLLDDAALINHINYCRGQSQYQPLGRYRLASHYDEALIAELLPELLRRIEEQKKDVT